MVSACGFGNQTLWNAALEGKSGVRPKLFKRLNRQRVMESAAVRQTDLAELMEGANPRFQDPVAMMALKACEEAINQSGLEADQFGTNCAVSIGSGLGGAYTLNDNFFRLSEEGEGKTDPLAVPKTMANSPASWISMKWGIKGPTYCVSTACASANQSIGLSLSMLRSGMVDRCIAGGAECMLTDGLFAGWERLHVMTNTKCRPFSAKRNGMVLGDGAGVLILETEESALARGATPLVELAGYSATTDAKDLLRPDEEGATSCLERAISDAGISVSDIGYVNAHGTGTVANDICEIQALRNVLGDHFNQVLISSTKPIHGHALGAAGALELAITINALQKQMAPPTINFVAVDPKIGIDPVSSGARPFSSPAALSNSFAFGGINSTLVLKRYDG